MGAAFLSFGTSRASREDQGDGWGMPLPERRDKTRPVMKIGVREADCPVGPQPAKRTPRRMLMIKSIGTFCRVALEPFSPAAVAQ